MSLKISEYSSARTQDASLLGGNIMVFRFQSILMLLEPVLRKWVFDLGGVKSNVMAISSGHL